MTNQTGYKRRHLPAGTTHCIYCGGSGCEKCGGKGYYCPDTQEPKHPTPMKAE